MADILSTVGFIALAIVLLLIMITIHEFGHYLAGKLLKFKIYEFAVGFGKVLYKRTNKNGEVFSLRLIPLGGYCSFGEDDPKNPETASDPDLFNNKAPWKRLIVLFMGAFFNFLSAIIFAVVLLCIVGYGRVIDTGSNFGNREDENDKDGINLSEILNLPNLKGDLNEFRFDEGVKEVDAEGKFIGYLTYPTHFIESINCKKMNLLPTTGASSILKNFVEGENISLVVIDEAGRRTDVTLVAVTERQWAALCNAYPTIPPGDNVYHNFGGALLKAIPFSFEVAGMILVLLWQLVSGQLGMEGVGGTVATVAVMGDVLGQALAGGALNAVSQICFLITLISINLAVFNLLPIPSLDGARMVFVIIEWIRGKPINRDLEARIHMIGIICLVGFVIFADIYWSVTHLAMHMLL